jgi:radical SAM superfamily enzyme YgiQ (UPF0313 family)
MSRRSTRPKSTPETGFCRASTPVTPRGCPARCKRAFIADLNKYPFPHDGPVAATETIFDRISVEIARGCTEGCRFCQAGMIYRPVRERDPQSVVDTIVTRGEEGGYDEASLTSLSTADYSHRAAGEAGDGGKLKGEKVSLSVSSLRAYGSDEELLDEIQSACAPRGSRSRPRRARSACATW